jgi:hypothetical protein
MKIVMLVSGLLLVTTLYAAQSGSKCSSINDTRGIVTKEVRQKGNTEKNAVKI